MVKSIGWDGTMGAFLVFVLIGGIYGFQASTASGGVDVTKGKTLQQRILHLAQTRISI